ncbi:MAG TPA: glycosyltransferase family 4 protein [Alphaproteobacteria bacterium]|nr:glycosyltransferase family 4 protein [Alphaproteobacteria bacterium]
MKICQLCAVDFTLYHFLLPLMAGLERAGHRVTGVCSDGPDLARVRALGFTVEPVEIARSYDLRKHVAAYRALVALFRRERFDLVHVHTPVASLVGRAAAWRAGVPRIVYTAHGFYFHERMAPWKRAVFIALEWLAGRATDMLFTQSQEDAATARRYRLCAGGRIHAIGNGVDASRFRPSSDPAARAALRASLGVPDGKVAILMVGRLVAEKGYLELLEAMRKVDAVLWIAGGRLESDRPSALDRALAALPDDPTLRARVRLLGYRDDVAELMRAADIYTLPSHREGMPRSIIEAMMTGLPVVATDIRGAREEVVPGETGALVPVEDAAALAAALDRLARDPDLRARQGTAGRKRALELYDERAVVARQLALLGL